MTVSILLDMNLSPDWVPWLKLAGQHATHWSSVGDPRAADATIMAWAVAHGTFVVTLDMDFGTTLALTHAGGPSVVQLRTQNSLPTQIGPMLLLVPRQYEAELLAGALIVLDDVKSRVRILPL